jgi:hypothetical protein
MPASGLSNVNQGSAFYINVVATAATDAYDATGAAAAASSSTVALTAAAAGSVLVRDMGKTVRIAAHGATSHYGSVSVALVLRKVQLVRGGPVDSNMGDANVPLSSFVGLNEGVAGTAANSFETFFIQLSPASKWARLSL